MKTSTLDSTKLAYCSLSDIDVSHLNAEYMIIKEVTMDSSVILPPYQIAYIINATEFSVKNPDSFSIYTDDGIKSGRYFLSQIPLLQEYYLKEKKHYPLANLLLGIGKTEAALNEIYDGIEEAVNYTDFKMIKNYCQLLNDSQKVSITERKNIYKKIVNSVARKNLKDHEFHSFIQYIGVIRELLVNNIPNQSRLEIVINTDFQQSDKEHIYELYEFIESIIDKWCSEQHVSYVEIRHNSPFQLVVTCIDSIPDIITILTVIYGGLSVAIPKVLDIIQQLQAINLTKNEMSYNEKYRNLELEEKKLDIEQKRISLKKSTLENKKLEQEIKLSTPTIIGVNEIRHTISSDSITSLEKIPANILIADNKRNK